MPDIYRNIDGSQNMTSYHHYCGIVHFHLFGSLHRIQAPLKCDVKKKSTQVICITEFPSCFSANLF